MLILVPRITNRLQYTFDFVFGTMLGVTFQFTTDTNRFRDYEGQKMSYGDTPLWDEPFQKSVKLLFEHDLYAQDLKPIDFLDAKAFFPVYSHRSMMPFDVLAAVFFLISRYEEYLPQIRDQYGRFTPESSCLCQLGLLDKPLVDIWVQELAKRLGLDPFPASRQYRFQPTYDVDAAWAYLHKGVLRTAGAYVRDLVAGDTEEVRRRNRVLFKHERDPFDSFDFQLQLQEEFHLKPIYFIHCGDYDTNDKSISIRKDAFRKLIKHLGDYADVGIHPSFSSYLDPMRLRVEVERLSEVLNREITKSRQHFLRMTLPRTYQRLIELDIKDDYTMGYASQVGFRAGTATAFHFYDLDNDIATSLTIHPFAVMDGTMKDYLNLSVKDSYDLVSKVVDEVRKVKGTFIYLTHNETLGGQKRWQGWPEMYRKILENCQ
ncbi:MAG: polysaccharide deacetylase family protein [Bacteroidales bacterium]|nr:polysaccharide deacetylase family protein [Bacteroidales bacterium]